MGNKNSILLLLAGSFFLTTLGAQVLPDSLIMRQLQEAKKLPSPDSMIAHTNDVLLLAKSRGSKRSIFAGLKQLAALYVAQGNSVQALRYNLEWLNLLGAERGRDYRFVNEQIGDIYYSEGIYGAALNYYLKAFSVKGKKKSALLVQKIGVAFYDNHQLDSAAVYFQKIWRWAHDNDDYPKELSSLQRLARVYELKKDCNTSLQYYRDIERLVNDQSDAKELPVVYNNLGCQYHCKGAYQEAIDNFKKTINYCQSGCSIDQITLFTNIGIAYFNNHQSQLGFDFLRKGLSLAQQEGDMVKIANIQHLLATTHLEQNELYEALQMNNDALSTSRKAKENELLKDIYLTEANIYERLYEYDKALGFYQKHLGLRDSLLLVERLRQEKLLQHQFNLEQSEKEMKLRLVNQKVQDLAFEQLELEKQKLELETNNLALLSDQKEKELALLRGEQVIRDEKLRFEALSAVKARQELSLTKQRLEAADKDKEILSLKDKETQQALKLAQNEAVQKEREKEILTLNNEKKLQAVELQKQQEFRNFVFWILGALAIILLLILYGYLFARRTNKKLEKQNREIEAQKIEIEAANEQSEQLLLNILPQETAKELMTKGFAEPRHYDEVSVLFADFENFTRLSEKMSPAQLIEELNICFVAFDEITSRHGLEKIKTIGDAYMCAGGIPVSFDQHEQKTVNAALEMMDFIDKRRAMKKKEGQAYWKMRIGIHTGPVVAGVVGNRKFAYDIWGDTVNVASRMESNSVPGKVNISKTTYKALNSDFKCEYRGKIAIKNRGVVDMYFVSIEP